MREKRKEKEEMDGMGRRESVKGREMERKMKMNKGVWVINVPLWHC